MNKRIDEMDLLCSNCQEEVEILSICQRAPHLVEVTFICPICGCTKTITSYLYTDR